MIFPILEEAPFSRIPEKSLMHTDLVAGQVDARLLQPLGRRLEALGVEVGHTNRLRQVLLLDLKKCGEGGQGQSV